MKKIIILLLCLLPIKVYAYDININDYNTKDLNQIVEDFDITTDKTFNTNGINIYLFYGSECAYSKALVEYYINNIYDDYKDTINVVGFEVWHDKNNTSLLKTIIDYKRLSSDGSPVLIIGDKIVEGYSESLNNIIKSYINNINKNYDIFEEMNKANTNSMNDKTKLIIISIIFILLLVITFIFICKKK